MNQNKKPITKQKKEIIRGKKITPRMIAENIILIINELSKI